MQSRYARLFQFILIIGDLCIVNACFIGAAILRFDEIKLQQSEYYNYYLQLIVFFNMSWLLLTFLFKTLDTKRNLEPRKMTAKVVNVFFAHIFLLLLVLVSLKSDVLSRLFLIYFYSALFIIILPWRFYFLRILQSYRKKGVNHRKVVLLGEGQSLKRFYNTLLLHPEYGLKFSGYYSDTAVEGIPFSGDEALLEKIPNTKDFDEIYCAFPPNDQRILKWFRWADEHVLRFRVIPDLGVFQSQNIEIDFFHDVPILVNRIEPLQLFQNRFIKRCIDVVISLLVLLLVFPILYPIVALGIVLSSKGPILFKQKRTGLGNKPFNIIKFRSMLLNAQADMEQATQNDVRFTTFGKLLRRFNIDELPQFYNVLIGDMSIVGPRPHMLVHTEDYRKITDRFMVRHFAKPGITGMAQINGFRGEVNTASDIESRVKYDIYYIENWSVLLDIKIILTTLWISIFPSKKS